MRSIGFQSLLVIVLNFSLACSVLSYVSVNTSTATVASADSQTESVASLPTPPPPPPPPPPLVAIPASQPFPPTQALKTLPLAKNKPNVQNFQRSYVINEGIRPYEYGYSTGIHPYSYSYSYPINGQANNANGNPTSNFNEPSVSAPDDTLNAIPLDTEDGDLAGLGGKSTDTDFQGILPGGNDFGGDPAADTDFPIQDNQGSSGLGLPDLNIESSENSVHQLVDPLSRYALGF